MTHILKTSEFIKESLGAALKDRTTDRFRGDKLRRKGEKEILVKQWEKTLVEISDDFNNHGDRYAMELLGTDKMDETFQIGTPGTTNEMYVMVKIDPNAMFNINDETWENLSRSQKTALEKIGIINHYDSSDEKNECKTKFARWIISKIATSKKKIPNMGFYGTETFEDDTIANGVYYNIANLEICSFAVGTLDYRVEIQMVYNPMSGDSLLFDFGDDAHAAAAAIIDNEINTPPSEYKKHATECYKGVIKFIWDTLNAEVRRIYR